MYQIRYKTDDQAPWKAREDERYDSLYDAIDQSVAYLEDGYIVHIEEIA
jgi:hypothetical protein